LALYSNIARYEPVIAKRSINPAAIFDLLGEWHWSAQYPAERAEWDAGTLYLGCRDCLDASPDHLRIESIVSTGFVGTWVNNQTGIARVVDDKGKTLPNPAGYLCAVRVAGMDH
jgi:hypothetical protein